MSDKKMNDFPTAADGAFVYAEDANGNQIKISKADLASVVAELLGIFSKNVYLQNGESYNLKKGYGLLILANSSLGQTAIYKMRAGLLDPITEEINNIEVRSISEYEISLINKNSYNIIICLTFIGLM